MRCFNHASVEAIGNCKACHKGLCAQCVADLGHGLACKGIHEGDVELLHSILSRSARIYSVTPKSRYLAPAFYAIMGLLFLGYSFAVPDRAFGLLFWMGAALVTFSVAVFVFNRRAYGQLK
jgi:hypothetical protein